GSSRLSVCRGRPDGNRQWRRGAVGQRGQPRPWVHGHRPTPTRGRRGVRRGLVITQDSGNRFVESLLATGLSRLEAEHGDSLAALDHITLAIRNFYESGNVAYIRGPLATLAIFLDRLGRLEPAATIAGFALNPLTATLSEVSAAITHL